MCVRVCVHAESLQSRPTLCDPVDNSLPSCCIHGILESRILEWVIGPPPGDLPDSRIEPLSLMYPELARGFFTTSATWEILTYVHICIYV